MNNLKYFSYIGNAYPHKNLERLVRAIVLLNQRINGDIKLKISSSRNIFTERLQSLIDKNNARKYIELMGYIPDSELNEFLKHSVAFVFPTLAEGFGIPPMEAIEAGTIVVQSNIPVLKEVYEDSTFYFNPMDTSSIADELERVMFLSNSERSKKIEYSQKFIKKYSWRKMAEETLRIYESIK